MSGTSAEGERFMSALKKIRSALTSGFGRRNSDENSLASAEALAQAGRYVDAIRVGTLVNRLNPDPELEWRLVQWRRMAFFEVAHPACRPDWPPAIEDPFAGLNKVAEIPASVLTSAMLGGGILHHGALIVRGLFNKEEAEWLANGVDAAMQACANFANGAPINETLPWYGQFPLPPESIQAGGRPFVEQGGGVWTADSPRMLFQFLEMLERKHIPEMIGEYLGERPALSIGKSTLRKVPVTTGTEWHQDGAFLGEDIRTVNMWLSLSHCGVDAPGLDMMPWRIPHIVETGTHGSHFSWAVGPGMADIVSEGKSIATPTFAPGDVIFFDQLFLHRTGIRPGMTKERLAIESWFFAPSTYPLQQEPILI